MAAVFLTLTPKSDDQFSRATCIRNVIDFSVTLMINYKKHLKNVGPIRHNEPPHAHSADVASGTVAHRLCIDVHDDIDNDDDDDNDNA